MMDPVPIIQNVLKLCSAVYTRVQETKDNGERFKVISNRVHIVDAALRRLTVPKSPSSAFVRGLNDLKDVLNGIIQFLGEITTRSYIGKTFEFIKQGDKQKFEDLNDKLAKAVELLKLGINIEQFANQQQYEEARIKDEAKLRGHVELILERQQEGLALQKEAIGKVDALIALKQRKRPMAMTPAVADCMHIKTQQSPEEIALQEGDKLFEHGRSYENGQQYDKAREFYLRAIQRSNNMKAMGYYGLLLFKGLGGAKDAVKGYAYLKDAADRGYARAQYYLGEIYESGDRESHIERNLTEALRWYEKARQSQFPNADEAYERVNRIIRDMPGSPGIVAKQTQVVQSGDDLYEQGSARENEGKHAEARKLYSEAIGKGSIRAKTRLGVLLCYGLGGRRDANQGYAFLKATAEAGDAKAQFYLGRIFEEGTVSRRDLPTALRMYEAAYKGGVKEAEEPYTRISRELSKETPKAAGIVSPLIRLSVFAPPPGSLAVVAKQAQVVQSVGDLYEQGCAREEEGKHAEARKLYSEAIGKGSIKAKRRLGFLLFYGLGGTRDTTQGYTFLKGAAEAGDAAAQFYLGRIFEEGTVFPKDLSTALRMYEAAYKGGVKEAEEPYRRISRELPRDTAAARMPIPPPPGRPPFGGGIPAIPRFGMHYPY